MTTDLKHCSEEDFFGHLEALIDFKIPSIIKNILSLTYFTTAYAFVNFDSESVASIESFMRSDFDKSALPHGSDLKEYLGSYCDSQEKFKLVGGQIKIIFNIAQVCQKLFDSQKTTTTHSRLTQGENTEKNADETSQTKGIIKQLFVNVFTWMQGHFSKIDEDELDFRVRMSSVVTKSNGSTSVFIKCPIKECMEGYTVSYKGYKKKNLKKPENSKSELLPRWQFSSLRQHVLKIHSNYASENNRIHNDDESSRNSIAGMSDSVHGHNNNSTDNEMDGQINNSVDDHDRSNSVDDQFNDSVSGNMNNAANEAPRNESDGQSESVGTTLRSKIVCVPRRSKRKRNRV